MLAPARRRLREVAKWRPDPAPVQEELLKELVSKGRKTTFGREHGFAAINCVADYQERVPLREYLAFKPYWDRLLEGATDVTWPGRISRFALTSGTTAGNKLIPVSREGIRSFLRAGRDVLNFYLQATEDTDLFKGKFLYLGGSTELKPAAHGIQMGDLSGIMAKAMPSFVERFRLPSAEANLIPDWEKKLEVVAKESVNADVRGISGTPSWVLCLFQRVFELKRAEGGRAETLADVWPNLSFMVHGGTSFEPYRKTFGDLFGKTVQTIEVYPASEGFIGIQDQLGEPDLLLMADTGLFYEFVPVEEMDKPEPTRLTVANVEKDVQYAIVLTTNSGLWSYVIGDIVRFTSLRPHRLRVTGRIKQFLNAFGEHLIAEEVENALTRAAHETDAEVKEFHLAPVYPSDPRVRPAHQCIVEFTNPPGDTDRFAEIFDAQLCEQNDDYAAHRKDDAGLTAPEVIPVPEGTFYDTMKSLDKLGGQHKVPRLSNERDFADQLLETARSHQSA